MKQHCFKIREASTADIPAIREMAEIVFRQTYKTILSPEQMEYMMDMMYSERSLLRQMQDEGNVFFIADGCGYVSIRPDGKAGDGRPRFHLEKIYVLPQWQGSGLGRELFETVLASARRAAAAGSAAGCPAAAAPGNPVHFLVELNVNRNNPAVGFYEHLGMRKDRQGDFPIGNGYYMNDYIMALDV